MQIPSLKHSLKKNLYLPEKELIERYIRTIQVYAEIN